MKMYICTKSNKLAIRNFRIQFFSPGISLSVALVPHRQKFVLVCAAFTTVINITSVIQMLKYNENLLIHPVDRFQSNITKQQKI